VNTNRFLAELEIDYSKALQSVKSRQIVDTFIIAGAPASNDGYASSGKLSTPRGRIRSLQRELTRCQEYHNIDR
jgi:hypothetical protein